MPDPVHAPAAHPGQFTHVPPGHWLSPVHQHETDTALHVPEGDVTSLQFPLEQP